MVLTESFKGTEWDAMRIRIETSEDAKQTFFSARAVFVGTKARTFLPEQYAFQNSLRLLMEKSYIVMSEAQFEQEFGTSARSVKGLTIEQFTTETGESMRGIVLADPAEPFLKLKAQYTQETNRQDMLLEARRQLRPGESHTVAQWYEKDLLRQRPAGVKLSLNHKQVKEMIEKTRLEEAAAAASAADAASAANAASGAQSAPAAGDVEESANAAKQEEEAAQDSDETDVDEDLVRASAIPQSGQAKGKGKKGGGKGKEKRRREREREPHRQAGIPKAKAPRLAAPKAISRSAEVAAGGVESQSADPAVAASEPQRLAPPRSTISVASSSRGSPKTARSSRISRPFAGSPKFAQLAEQAERYLRSCNLPRILDGHAEGTWFNNTWRIINALEKKRPACAEAVQLRAAYNLAYGAASLGPASLHNLDSEKLKSLSEEVLPQVPANELGGSFQEAWISRHLKDCKLTSMKDIEHLVDTVLLGSSGAHK